MSSGGRQRGYGAPTNSRRDRDEDLILFKEMFKRERERPVSLLQPDSEEFDPIQGNYALVKLPLGKKGSDFLAVDEKNDYDWLKTPPATPLFPSLELEANEIPLANLIVHKELPILQPIKPSRFSSDFEKPRASQRPKSPSSSSASSSRSVTPKSNFRSSHNSNDRANHPNYTFDKKPNYARTPRKQNPDSKPPSRGVSPQNRSRLPATLPGFTDEAPANLITSKDTIQGRAASTARGRAPNVVTGQPEATPETGKARRQSCSPSMMRGRKGEEGGKEGEKKGGRVVAGNGSVIVGSRMVERMMNARRTATAAAAAVAPTGDEKQGRFKSQGFGMGSEGSGFGRLMSRASLDTALKNLEEKKKQGVLPQANTGRFRNATPTTNSVLNTESPRPISEPEARILKGRFSAGDQIRPIASKKPTESKGRFGLC